jgi:selenide,water dikinase
MATLNKSAADAMIEVGVNAATDVTGFGLLGHLSQMMKASGTTATVRWSDIPILPGALELARAGSVSGGTARNMESLEGKVVLGEGVSEFEFMVLADAQTSGGMLISVPEERSDALVKSLVTNQTLYSELIGKVSGSSSTPGIVTIEA